MNPFIGDNPAAFLNLFSNLVNGQSRTREVDMTPIKVHNGRPTYHGIIWSGWNP